MQAKTKNVLVQHANMLSILEKDKNSGGIQN
jgi:hypothetical protein